MMTGKFINVIIICGVIAVVLDLCPCCSAGEDKPIAKRMVMIPGFDPGAKVDSAEQADYQCFTGKKVLSFYEYPRDGKQFVEWRTPSLPEPVAGTCLVIACGFGISKGFAAEHELAINGKPILTLTPPQCPDQQWSGKGASAIFHTLMFDDAHDVFGVMYIKLPAGMIVGGQRLTIRIIGKRFGSSSWFMLSSVQVPWNIDIYGMQKKNRVAEKFAKYVTVKKRKPGKRKKATTRICRWRGGKKAALSFASDDGHISVIEAFHPILEKHGYRGTSFIITGRVQGSRVSRSTALHDYAGHFKRPLADELADALKSKTTLDNFWQRLFLLHYLKFPPKTPKSYIRLQKFNAIREPGHVNAKYMKMLDRELKEAIGVYCPLREKPVLPEKWQREGKNRHTNWDDWRMVVNRGHAIGSHTVTHGFTGFLPPEMMKFEIMESKREIERWIPGYRCDSIAFPCGNCTRRLAELVNKVYIYDRSGSSRPYNPIPEYAPDIRASRLSMGYCRLDKPYPDYADDTVETAITAGVWLPEVYHSFKETEARGNIRPKAFSKHLDFVKTREFFLWIDLGERIFKYTRERLHAKLQVKKMNNSVRVSLTDDLENTVYNMPLTVQVEVPDHAMLVECFHGGVSVPCTYVIENYKRAIRFEMLPDSGAIEVRWQ